MGFVGAALPRVAYRVGAAGRYLDVSIDGMTLFGAGLIAGGIVLLASAFVGSRGRTYRRATHTNPRRPDWPMLDRFDHRGFDQVGADGQPLIRRSALLAETVRLNQIPAAKRERTAAAARKPTGPSG